MNCLFDVACFDSFDCVWCVDCYVLFLMCVYDSRCCVGLLTLLVYGVFVCVFKYVLCVVACCD